MDGLAARTWAGVVLATATALAAAPAAGADPTPAQAIAELNGWRAQVGEQPVSSTPVASWDPGCQATNNYNHLNHMLTHFETPGAPGYTAAGADAAMDSVLSEQFSSTNPTPDAALLPGPNWDAAVFHRAALLQPRLGQVGWDSTTFQSGNSFDSFECMWVENSPADPAGTPSAFDNTRTTSSLTLYPAPANGAAGVPTAFPAGSESPDPAAETGVPAGASLGWLLNVEINGPWGDQGGGGIVFAHGVTASLAPDGGGAAVPVVVSQCGPSGCANGDPGGTKEGIYFGGGFGIFPLQPLAANTTYRAVLTGGTVTDTSTTPATNYPIPSGFSWCFSTERRTRRPPTARLRRRAPSRSRVPPAPVARPGRPAQPGRPGPVHRDPGRLRRRARRA